MLFPGWASSLQAMCCSPSATFMCYFSNPMGRAGKRKLFLHPSSCRVGSACCCLFGGKGGHRVSVWGFICGRCTCRISFLGQRLHAATASSWHITEKGGMHATCFLTFCCRYEECSQIWTQTTDYFQVVGIILGQLTVGFLGDWLGRRWGLIQVIPNQICYISFGLTLNFNCHLRNTVKLRVVGQSEQEKWKLRD